MFLEHLEQIFWILIKTLRYHFVEQNLLFFEKHGAT
jgi:hypothetical protein